MFRFVIVKAFYPLHLIVSYKPSIHFHPRLTLGLMVANPSQVLLYNTVEEARDRIIANNIAHLLCVTDILCLDTLGITISIKDLGSLTTLIFRFS